jgi:hypothetical protein
MELISTVGIKAARRAPLGGFRGSMEQVASLSWEVLISFYTGRQPNTLGSRANGESYCLTKAQVHPSRHTQLVGDKYSMIGLYAGYQNILFSSVICAFFHLQSKSKLKFIKLAPNLFIAPPTSSSREKGGPHKGSFSKPFMLRLPKYMP